MMVDPGEALAEPAEPLDYGKGLAWTMGFNAIVKIVSGGIAIYIMRRLDPGQLGMFGLLANIYIFAEQMREAGLKQAFYNDNIATPIRFRTYARLSVVSGITFELILSLASKPLSIFFGYPQLGWSVICAAFGTCMNGFSVIPIASLHKAGRFRDVGLIETTANLVSVGVALAMVLRGYGFEALVAQLVVRAVVQFGLAFWQRPYSILNHDRSATKTIMRVCTPLVATDILWLMYSLIDQFTIVKILGMRFSLDFARSANGFYAQGRKLVGIPSDFFFYPLLRTVTVAIGNRSNDPEHLARTFMKAICLAVLTLASIFGAIAALSRPLVIALFTEKWSGTIPILGIICLGESFRLTGTFAGSALVAAGKSRIPLFAWLLPYPIMAAGVLLAWHHISLNSIVWSYVVGMVAVNAVVTSAGFRFLKVEHAQLSRFWECVAIGICTTAIAYGFSKLPLHPWPLILLAGIVIPALHVAIIGTVFARNPMEFFSRSAAGRLRDAL